MVYDILNNLSALFQTKEANMKRIILTGGTGFIGSHIAAELLTQGHFVYFLARSHSSIPADERVLRALAPLTLLRRDRYKVIDGDLISPLDHLAPENIDEAWHCAASLSFKDEDEIETLAINVDGTEKFLGLLTRIGTKRLHFISTAYISYSEPNNPYEKSKAKAEIAVKKWSARNKSGVTIYRPSIIVGNSKTGFASKFNGYYTCARAIYLTKQFLEADLQRNPKKYYNSGIHQNDGILTAPIAFPGLPNTLINIIPIDLAVAAIMDCSNNLGTFQITNTYPPRLDELIRIGTKILGMRGMYVGEPQAGSDTVLSALNQRIKNTTKHYRPYLCKSDVGEFPDKSIKFPITEKFISLILGYAMSVNFKGG